MQALKETNFHFPEQTGFYRGKVRDVYYFKDKLAMVATDRISAFDVVLPRAIPYKGQVLNQIAAKFLAATANVVPNWVISQPAPNVTIGRQCETFKVEMVIRGYLAGHAWREYSAGKRLLCGVAMPDGLRENDPFPEPIITPTTKAAEGHDEDISREEILRQGIVSEEDYLQLEAYTRALFKRGSELAAERGLILVDTKYEFGKADGTIMVIDEIHTPDSSRFFYSEGYEDRQNAGQPQRQLSKEFVRQWLIENGFQGKEGQQVPEMTDDKITEISQRYIELYEQVLGEKFIPQDYASQPDTLQQSIAVNIF
ncbi:phosphoribosylaminoimidazolesuccinocarboxamide synthase [Rufibacter quisquiliarum]|uniref:Phosphoribosylaminoimidazole-succinocarboxamide synthase n=1 Tax=Rufibacter quisquiliarum TaxID=1549639 RepID=A0A839GTP3_9BACT|nr:phosphoribosylaminoimidazolesuccinocarboxamide synthase [Rufibacter quisquiliarum]MBA9077768.1 phosphoribosylaminoimidazole-succinocarboxamide synthase [Rufibacter quisquiliarum]